MDEPVNAGSLAQLRNQANDHAGAQRWAALLELEDALRGDGDYWTSFWGPACAIARWHEGREGARELLRAQGMLAWATNYWQHSGISHVDVPDANLVLERVGNGERFACLEYTIVLTQALNAVRIPARRMSLYRSGYHTGAGTAHAVTEAWIDDLGKWVLLDGQNGATWRDAEGVPLGALELQQRYRDGDQPEFVGAGRNFHADTADTWFEFFHTVSVHDGLAWSAGPYVPLMEGATVIGSERLACSAADAAPDLAAISTGVTDQQGPALIFRADHPYVSGFAVSDPDGAVGFLAPGEPLRLARGAGEHRLTVSVKTHYGILAPQLLHYVAR